MTLHLFRTFRAGPVRVTLSRSGISESIGTKRIRVGTKPSRRGALRYSVKVPGTSWRLRKG
jgi:hypothetical protein